MPRLHLAAALLAVAACNGEPSPLSPGSVLPDDFIVYDTSRFENTAKVIAPEENVACVDGAIVLATGEMRPGELVTRPLTVDTNAIDTTTIGTATPYPFDFTIEDIATDNQMIRLADGSLLVMKNGYRWDAIAPQPAWWDAFSSFDGTRANYSRNTIYFWRSVDCGATWTRVGMIDPAAIADGRYAWPQPADENNDGVQDRDDAGRLAWGVGGFDRPELYQDPVSQTIYVSGHGDGGPFPVGDALEDHHAEALFVSNDNGATWNLWTELTNYPGKGNAPFVMTSTPNERFYAFTCGDGTPRLLYTSTPGDRSELLGVDVDDEGDCDRDLDNPIATDIWQPSISRVSLDTTSSVVRVAYPTTNSDNRQEYEVVNIAVDDADPHSSPDVTEVDTVTSEDASRRSVLYASFIDPDAPFDETPSDKAILYWIESSTGSDPVKLCAKYKAYSGTSSLPSTTAYLSRSGDQPRCWSDATQIGDYMSGGFFFNGELNYFAQWPEADGIHGTVVTLTP